MKHQDETSCRQWLAALAAVFSLSVVGVASGAAYEDANLSSTDDSVVRKTVGERIVYVFTNAAATVTLKQAMTLEEVLVVGGGGAGGWSQLTPSTDQNYGGSAGGGGGGVVWTNPVTALKAGESLSVAVGAGGDPTENYDETTNPYPAGGNGGASTLTVGDQTVTAYGGGGGAGYGSRYPGTGALGSGGGFVRVANNDYRITGEGLYYTAAQGNCGSYTLSAGTGGGGGAGQRMLRGISDNRGNVGGEGLPIAITGTREVYGSGGGGGYPYKTQTNVGGVGGTNAGQGLSLSSGKSQHGVDGFGGGGGGSSRRAASAGGRGGCGTVILSFSVGDASAQKLTVDPIGRWPLKNGVAEPVPVVRCGDAVLTLGTDYTVSYANNTERGKVGIVEVTGIGAYAGRTAHQTFDSALVLYASQDGSDAADGSSWANATSVSNALLLAEADGYREIWLKAGDYPLTASYVTTKAIAVRGGYAGDDAMPNRLAASPYSVFDGHDKVGNCFTINQVKTSMPEVEFERCVFQHATVHNLYFQSYYGLRLIDCKFLANVSGQGQSGRGLYVDGNSKSPATLIDCEIGGNVLCVTTKREDGSGCGAYFTDADVWMDGCLFASNGLTAAYSQSSYPNSNHSGVIFSAPKVRARNCRFIGNRGASRWGSDSSQGGGLCNVSGNGSSFENCLWLGNSDQSMSDLITYKGGCLYTGSAITITVSRCTFAYNLQMGKNVSAGITMAGGHVFVKDSIFYGNATHKDALFGADIGLTASAYATVSNSFFGAGAGDPTTRADYLYSADSTHLVLADDVQYGDPKFVTPAENFLACTAPRNSGVAGVPKCTTYTTFDAGKTADVLAFDVHLLSSAGYYTNDGTFHKDASVTSPAILSDGTNLGCYGGTAEASKLSSVSPAIEGDVTVVWTNNTSQPVISFYLGGNGGAAYNAKVTVRYGVEGNVREVVYPSLAGQQRITLLGDTCFPKDADFAVAVSVEASGASASGGYSGKVEGDYPASWGKGGGARVLHVRSGAMGKGDGSDWFNAMTDFYAALDRLDAERPEVWVAGTNEILSVHDACALPIAAVLRGGFTGVENAAAERKAGVVSVVDGANQYQPLAVSNAYGLEVERLAFVRGSVRNVKKTGDGDVTFTDCRFSDSIGEGGVEGRGVHLTGGGATVARFERCAFADNRALSPSSRFSGRGVGAYFTACGRVELEDCEFRANGMAIGRKDPKYSQSNGNHGAAVYAVNAPVVARGCRFVANSLPGDLADESGTVSLSGACGGSAFTNCLFAGNESYVSIGKVSGKDGIVFETAAIVAKMDAADKTLDVSGCTFAYNLTGGCITNAADVYVRSGSVKIRNSVFVDAYRSTNPTYGMSVVANADAKLDIAYCIFPREDSVVQIGQEAPFAYGSGVVFGDPQLVTPIADIVSLVVSDGDALRRFSTTAGDALESINAHLRGRGYCDETTGLVTEGYPRSKWSPALDAGDPTSDYRREPQPNGIRINLGFYGNTPWATMSRAGGLTLILR